MFSGAPDSAQTTVPCGMSSATGIYTHSQSRRGEGRTMTASEGREGISTGQEGRGPGSLHTSGDAPLLRGRMWESDLGQ